MTKSNANSDDKDIEHASFHIYIASYGRRQTGALAHTHTHIVRKRGSQKKIGKINGTHKTQIIAWQ